MPAADLNEAAEVNPFMMVPTGKPVTVMEKLTQCGAIKKVRDYAKKKGLANIEIDFMYHVLDQSVKASVRDFGSDLWCDRTENLQDFVNRRDGQDNYAVSMLRACIEEIVVTKKDREAKDSVYQVGPIELPIVEANPGAVSVGGLLPSKFELGSNLYKTLDEHLALTGKTVRINGFPVTEAVRVRLLAICEEAQTRANALQPSFEWTVAPSNMNTQVRITAKNLADGGILSQRVPTWSYIHADNPVCHAEFAKCVSRLMDAVREISAGAFSETGDELTVDKVVPDIPSGSTVSYSLQKALEGWTIPSDAALNKSMNNVVHVNVTGVHPPPAPPIMKPAVPTPECGKRKPRRILD